MDFPLTVAVSPNTIALKPGGSAPVTVSVRNISPVVQHYEALVVGLPDDRMWQRDTETTKLRPGESGTITLTVTLPLDTPVLGGTYVLGVLVRSPYQPREVSRAEELTLTVETIAGIEMSAFPEVIDGRDTDHFVVTVTNTGNTPTPLELVATDEQGKATFLINPRHIALPAGATQPVQVQVDAPRPFSGQEQRSAITVRALASGEQLGEARVTLVQPPKVPAAVLRAVGLVLAVAVVAGSIIIGGLLARRSNAAEAPPSAPPPSGQSSAPVTQSPQAPPPTSASSSAAGQSPPAAPMITVDPAQPVVGEEVVFGAQVPEGITFAWELFGGDGAALAQSTDPELRHSFAQAGPARIRLTITGEGGEAAAEMTINVADRPPNVQVVSEPLELPNEEVATLTVMCPDPKVAVGGGAYGDPSVSAGLLIESSRPIDGGKGWSVAIRNTGEDAEVTVSATCINPFEGLILRPEVEEEATDVRRALAAECDPGTVVVGGGGGFQPVDDAGSRALINESIPAKDTADGSDRFWQIGGESTTPRILESLVWCAPAPPGYAVVVSDQPAPIGSGVVEAVASCPAGQAISGGIGFSQGVGAVQVDPNRSILYRASAPSVARPGETGQGWVGSATFTVELDQTVGVYVVCAQLDGS